MDEYLKWSILMLLSTVFAGCLVVAISSISVDRVRSAMARYWPLASLVVFTCSVNAVALLTRIDGVFLVASVLLLIHSAMVALLLSLAITGKVSRFMSLGYHSGADKDNFWSWAVNTLLCSVFIVEYCYFLTL